MEYYPPAEKEEQKTRLHGPAHSFVKVCAPVLSNSTLPVCLHLHHLLVQTKGVLLPSLLHFSSRGEAGLVHMN